jgi:hypothetical protein
VDPDLLSMEYGGNLVCPSSYDLIFRDTCKDGRNIYEEI